jgi:hypothetical protein
MKFYFEYDCELHKMKVFGPMAPGYAYEGELIAEFPAAIFSTALKQAENIITQKYKDSMA